MIRTKFIDYKEGGPEQLFVNERQIEVKEGDCLMKVKAVGINRAETLHRMGKYPAQSECEKYLGLEAAGEIVDPQTKQKICDGIALLSGGSYSQWAAIPKTHVMPLPDNFTYSEGAALPEAWLTAFQILGLAELQEGSKVVVYAGASGVGTAAIQICNLLKYEPFAVVSNPQKGELCKKLGVKGIAYYKDNMSWDKELIEANDGGNFDAVIDCVCAENVKATTNLLKVDGRWVLYGALSGSQTQFDFGLLLRKRIKLVSTTLKTRSKEYKDLLIENFRHKILPGFESKKVMPVIDREIKSDWCSAQAFISAHRIMGSNENAGKIIVSYQQ